MVDAQAISEARAIADQLDPHDRIDAEPGDRQIRDKHPALQLADEASFQQSLPQGGRGAARCDEPDEGLVARSEELNHLLDPYADVCL